jgi:hypothetical protein
MEITIYRSSYSAILKHLDTLKTVNEKILYLKRIEADVKRGDTFYHGINNILEKLQVDIDFLNAYKTLQPEVKENKEIDIYISILEKRKVSTLNPKELEEVSGISSSKWNRLFKDAIFIGALLKALKKKKSSAKTKVKKQEWQQRISEAESLIDKIPQMKDALSRKNVPYNDNIRQQDTYADIEEVRNEEVNPRYASKMRAKPEQD